MDFSSMPIESFQIAGRGRLLAVIALGLIASGQSSVSASATESVLSCSGRLEASTAICHDQRLRDLAREIDTKMARLTAGADPLTASLLRRDQRWYTDLLGIVYVESFNGPNDPQRTRIETALEKRLNFLNQLQRWPASAV
jgi:hypothetical protein